MNWVPSLLLPVLSLLARWSSFREGDRSEYLAQYLLSGIGMAAPVLRQEDIGYDFFGAVGAEKSTGLLVFGPAFGVQAKSVSSPNVEIGGLDKNGTWLRYQIEWLDAAELPLLLAVVDKKSLSMQLFSTSAAQLAFAKSGNSLPGKLVLTPRTKTTGGDVTYPTTRPLGFTSPQCDGLIHTVDLDPPLATVDYSLLADKISVNACRRKLREALEIEHESLMIRRTGVGYFYWLVRLDGNGEAQYAWMMRGHHAVTDRLLRSAAVNGCLLAQILKSNGKVASQAALKAVLQDAGVLGHVPAELQGVLWP